MRLALIEVLFIAFSTMLACGLTAYRFAKDYGRSPMGWFIIGFVMPLVGLGMLMILGRKRGYMGRFRHG